MASGDKSIAIIIPTLNEEPTIGELIDNIHSLNISPKPIILIVDGGSIDNTVGICKKKNTKIIVQRRKGKGSAIREAVDQIVEDIIIFIDGDGTYSIPEIELLLKPLLEDRADMVVGSRIHGDSKKGKGIYNRI